MSITVIRDRGKRIEKCGFNKLHKMKTKKQRQNAKEKKENLDQGTANETERRRKGSNLALKS